MACQILTSPNWFSHALAAMNSPKSCAVRCVALLTCRSPREHCYAGIRSLSRWAASGPARVTFQRLEGATLGGGKPWNAIGRIGAALGVMCLIALAARSPSRGTISFKILGLQEVVWVN